MIPQFDIKHYALGILLLAVLFGCTTEAERRHMRAGLDSINVLNRTDQPFTPEDVRPYVDFFDKEAKAFFTLLSSDSIHNDQLLAHYLLGRAYHKKGDAPMALECYQHAIDHADTTAMSDKDFAQLSRVYAQMAEIFSDQDLFRQQLTHDNLSVKYALRGKDTLAALMSYELKYYAYKKLDLIDSAIQTIEDVSKLYTQYGFTAEAAISLGSITRTLIDRGELEKASNYMEKYESKSGLFNDEGNILAGREIYYYFKGLFYLKTNRLDSAEYWYRKELSDGLDYNNQNGGALGLAEVFMAKHIPDSAAKYFRYAYAMNDSMYAYKTTKTIERMQSMYDYSRHQEIAHQEEKKAAQRTVIIWICIGIILLTGVVGYSFYNHANSKRREIEKQYLQGLDIIRQARLDIERLKSYTRENAALIEEKEHFIETQKDILKGLSSETLIYKKFSIKGQEPTSEEWQQIEEQVYDLYPAFRQFLKTCGFLLNDKEQKTCLLIRAGFKPKSISNMLNVGPSYISNIRSEMYKKLFGTIGSPKDFDRKIKEMG